MKTRLFGRVWAALLAGIFTLGALGCLLTVYGLPVSPRQPTAAFLGAVLLGLWLLPLRRGPEITVCACALVLGYLLHLPETVGQIKSLLYLVSRALDGYYHWGYFSFPGLVPGEVGIPLAIYACFLGLSVCRSILRRRTSFLPIFLAAPSVVLCALVPGQNPAVWAVFCLMTGAGILLLTSGARRNSAQQGLKLTWMVCLPVVACTGVLLLCNPQSTYVDRAAPVREAVLARLKTGVSGITPGSFVPRVSYESDLSALDGGEISLEPVLTVTAPVSGDLYLRGQDYDTYTGTGWRADPERIENFDGWGEETGTLSIKTFGVKDLIYLPYFPGTGTILTGGALPNTGGTVRYSFSNHPRGSAMTGEGLEIYLRLPEQTRVWAKEWLHDGIGTEEIGALVRNSAVYDLETPRLPEGETDFVRWFLDQSDRGYCVHFASAATVLLRAAGIPARYVTGYCRQVEAGEPCVVTTQEAHAWTEYYDVEAGCWKILDATPAGSGPETQPQIVESIQPEKNTRPRKETQSPGWGQVLALWLTVPAWALLLVLRRWLVRKIRELRIRRSSARKRVLLLWQEAESLARAVGRPIPEELLELAQKARFSQHRITAMDAVPLETFCQECRERLGKRPWWRNFWDQFILVRF